MFVRRGESKEKEEKKERFPLLLLLSLFQVAGEKGRKRGKMARANSDNGCALRLQQYHA